jgi:hypothetical protein
MVAVTTQPSNGFGFRSSSTFVVPTVRSTFCHLEISEASSLNTPAAAMIAAKSKPPSGMKS